MPLPPLFQNLFGRPAAGRPNALGNKPASPAAGSADPAAGAASRSSRSTMEGRSSSAAPHMPFPVLPSNAPAPIQRRDEIKIDLSDAQQEPEERKVERVHNVGILLTLGGRPLPGALADRRMHAAVAEDYGSAGQLAQNLLTRCGTCVHFDRDRAKPFISAAIEKMKQSVVLDSRGHVRSMAERKQAWQALISREDIIKVSGICNAISEVMSKHNDGALRAPWLVHPDGGCPAPAQLLGPGGEDLSNLYKERERKAHAKGSGTFAYDKIMKTASGKKE